MLSNGRTSVPGNVIFAIAEIGPAQGRAGRETVQVNFCDACAGNVPVLFHVTFPREVRVGYDEPGITAKPGTSGSDVAGVMAGI